MNIQNRIYKKQLRDIIKFKLYLEYYDNHDAIFFSNLKKEIKNSKTEVEFNIQDNNIVSYRLFLLMSEEMSSIKTTKRKDILKLINEYQKI